jgi:hypothetical protein
MRRIVKHLVVGSLLLLGGGACADLEVVNLNNADAARALATPGDVESLIIGSYNSWFAGTYSNGGPGAFMSNQSFQHTAPWANFGMEYYGRIPRTAIENTVSDQFYSYFVRGWYRSYRAIAALADGIRALGTPEIADELGASAVAMDKAYGKYVQALSHATVALMYDQGFVVTEETDLTQPQEPLGYLELMDVALGLFDDAIALCNTSFTLPYNWMQADIDNVKLAKLAHSMKARFRAQVARTPEERAAVNWASVVADVDAGLTETYYTELDWDNGWYDSMLDYSTDQGWSQMAYWMWGMADQSGRYQDWLALPIGDKNYDLPDGRNVIIITPDLRFPQGNSVAEQRLSDSYAIRMATAAEAGQTWKRPDRGVWRWSWYNPGPAFEDYWIEENWFQPDITIAEMRLLKAEALFRQGGAGLAQAATIINETRVAAGLNPTDASGTNTSCVPKLPNGSCGNLWEMLKWEKRMETVWTGINRGNWFYDGRGWGDLWYETPLQFPVPCQELEVLQLLPCASYGGPGGEFGSPGSTYNFPFEK